MEVSSKNRSIDDVYNDLKIYKVGLLLTLNTYQKDEITLTENALELGMRLNSFCYGRQYKRRERLLRIVGFSEYGKLNQGLHMHMLIMHNDDTTRSFPLIENFARGEWYSLIHAKLPASTKGSLVDLRPIYGLMGITEYVHKTFDHKPNQFNPLYC